MCCLNHAIKGRQERGKEGCNSVKYKRFLEKRYTAYQANVDEEITEAWEEERGMSIP